MTSSCFAESYYYLMAGFRLRASRMFGALFRLWRILLEEGLTEMSECWLYRNLGAIGFDGLLLLEVYSHRFCIFDPGEACSDSG